MIEASTLQLQIWIWDLICVAINIKSIKDIAFLDPISCSFVGKGLNCVKVLMSLSLSDKIKMTKSLCNRLVFQMDFTL